MNKEFSKEKQALDMLYDVSGNVQNLTEEYNVLKKALQRLEAIDNADTSRALECLEVLENCASVCGDYSKRANIVRQALLKAQEQEKENIKYKTLEEEIGCPLEVLFKLAKQRHFYYEENDELHLINCFDIELFNNKIYFDSNWIDYDIELGDFGTIELPLNEYGKTFWLRKDKSE